MMKIAFTKNINKKHSIACTRDDGSQTWMQCDDFFIVHDLMHYAAEITLAYKNAFYGMLANGVSITDFELPKAQRKFQLTEEAIITEHLVNLLTIEAKQGTLNDFNMLLAESFTKSNTAITTPVFSQDQLLKIKSSYKLLINQWIALGEHEQMVLHFKK